MNFGTFCTLKEYIARLTYHSHHVNIETQTASTRSRTELARSRGRTGACGSCAVAGRSRKQPSLSDPGRTLPNRTAYLVRRNQCHRTPGELNKVSECSKKRRPGWKFWSKHIIQFTAGVRSVDCAAPTFKMGSFASLLLSRFTPGLGRLLSDFFVLLESSDNL